MSTVDVRFVLFIVGALLLFLAASMLVPLAVDLGTSNSDWLAFLISAAITSYFGGVLVFACRGAHAAISSRTGYLLTVACWCAVCAFGSLPLLMSSLHLSVTDAVFETMSGLTTTGSTILTGLDHLPPGLLLWRSLLQWLGGIGIVVMAMVLLPMLRVGGMQLFRSESSDISDKPVARTARMVGLTIIAYATLSVICAISYRIAGMNTFDAVNHAMATLAGGGFSTKDASLGYYHSVWIEIVAIIFMVSGALPLILYPRLVMEGPRALHNERQVPVFLSVLVVGIALITAWNTFHNHMPVFSALRATAVNVTSILTDTGFTTRNFAAWGAFPVGVLFILLLVGGCAGSTAGAIKVFRWHVLFTGAVRQLRQMRSPRRIIPSRYAGRTLSPEMMQSVRNFFFMYLITLLVLSLGLMATGIDFLSSTSDVATAMANAGPGLGPIGGPATTFAGLPDLAKWFLILAMILGRLELSTVYTLLLPDFWRE